MTVDLNCDLGESFGAYSIGEDEAVLPLISSASIACGFHAGDPLVMDRTVEMAVKSGCVIGAHPGFPDLQGFGRRNMDVKGDELEAMLIYQVGALDAFCRRHHTRLRYVKPHGALYNMCAADEHLSRTLVHALLSLPDAFPLMGMSQSWMTRAAEAAGLPVLHEVFADRAYHADGRLVSRREPGSVLRDPEAIALRALRMVTEGVVDTLEGTKLHLKCDSICIHGDSPAALESARAIRACLSRNGITVASPLKGEDMT